MNNLTKLLISSLLCLFSSLASAQVNTNRMMQVGRNALYFEDYVLSIQYFNRVINVKPYLPEPYYYRAIAKYYLDDLDGCIADCDVALGINPFLIDAYNLRGISKLRQDHASDARDDFSTGLEYEPDNVNLLLNCGIAEINLKNYDDAIAAVDKALKYDRNNTAAILYRGIAIVERGDTALAMAEFERAAKINKYSPDAHAYIGMLAYQTRDFKRALEEFNTLNSLRPMDPAVLVNRAITRYNLDDWRGCLEDLNEALRIDPKNKMALMNRGMLRQTSGDLNNAAEDFSRLLALDPSDDIALMNRASVYVQTSEYSNAMRDLNIIIAKHPDFGPAYAQRALVKRALGDSKGAEVDYMTAMNFEQERVKKGLDNAARADRGEKTNSDDEKIKSRSKGDQDLKKYNQLVVVSDFEDHDEKLAHEDMDKIRGRVQDRDIAIDLEPVFSLSFFAADTLLPNARYFRQSVQDFNALHVTPQQLVVSNRDFSTASVSAAVFDQIALATREIESRPSDPNLYLWRGSLYQAVMNYNLAIADYGAALDRDPHNVNALLCRAATRYKMVETIREMESVSTSEMSMHSGLQDEVRIMDYDLIRQDLDALIKLEPDNEFALYDLALVDCAVKKFDDAHALLDKALVINPLFAEAYYNRGIIRLHLGDSAAGSADLSKAGELGMFKAYNVLKRRRNSSKQE